MRQQTESLFLSTDNFILPDTTKITTGFSRHRIIDIKRFT